MLSQHLTNIQGCLKRYADLDSARSWIARARHELPENDVYDLIQSTYNWAIRELRDHALIDGLMRILAEFDAHGDKSRRSEFERVWQQKLIEERAKEDRLRQEEFQAEGERLARKERERARAQRAADAENERLRLAQLQQEANLRKNSLLTEIDKCLQTDFCAADDLYRTLPNGIISALEFEERKTSFVRKWFTYRLIRTGGSERFVPDMKQIAAIAAVNGHIQVVARAGSGKTATLVNRALFLLEHCRVSPERLLLLAFNRKAATEIRRQLLAAIHDEADQAVRAEIDERARATERKNRKADRDKLEAEAVGSVANRLKVGLPHVMTFHALAYAIVHPEESLLYDDTKNDTHGLSIVVKAVIADHLRIPEFQARIRNIMMAHFRADWDRIATGRYEQSKDDFLRFRRSLPQESLGGDYVKSRGEKLIADFLFQHNISYKYERNFRWNDGNYRPDFTIPHPSKSGLIIEYFGLAGDPDYDEMSREKRIYWRSKEPDWKLLEFSPRDIASRGEDEFKAFLKRSLEERGTACCRLSEDEIWHRLRDRAIDGFTTAVKSFMGRCRQQSLSPNDLRDLVASYRPLHLVEKHFLELAQTLYAAYLKRLSATGEDDFDGLMQRAASAVSSGRTKFQRKSVSGDLVSLRYGCIDEYQDFSELFFRMLCAIRQASPCLELFCVGDDWQAINGLAVSDLKFFERFEEYVGGSRRLYISTNYRSSSSIVAVGNALMKDMGKPAVAYKASPGSVVLSDTGRFKPSLIEKERHQGDIITPMVVRIANSVLAAGSELVVLSRRHTLPWFVKFADQEHDP